MYCIDGRGDRAHFLRPATSASAGRRTSASTRSWPRRYTELARPVRRICRISPPKLSAMVSPAVSSSRDLFCALLVPRPPRNDFPPAAGDLLIPRRRAVLASSPRLHSRKLRAKGIPGITLIHSKKLCVPKGMCRRLGLHLSQVHRLSDRRKHSFPFLSSTTLALPK